MLPTAAGSWGRVPTKDAAIALVFIPEVDFQVQEAGMTRHNLLPSLRATTRQTAGSAASQGMSWGGGQGGPAGGRHWQHLLS